MLNQNLKILRKNKGFTQEELANKINVTRQTVSKWEKGYSVPDADLLTKIADVLEISVSELLGSEEIALEDKDSLSEQLARINEQLSTRNRRSKRIWKTVLVLVLASFVVIPGTVTILGMLYSADFDGADVRYNGSTEWVHSLNGEEYEYEIQYDKNYKIVSTEGDAYIEEHINPSSYKDANEAGKAIERYFKEQGGEEIRKEVKQLPLKDKDCHIEGDYLIVEQVLPDEYKDYDPGDSIAYKRLD